MLFKMKCLLNQGKNSDSITVCLLSCSEKIKYLLCTAYVPRRLTYLTN